MIGLAFILHDGGQYENYFLQCYIFHLDWHCPKDWAVEWSLPAAVEEHLADILGSKLKRPVNITGM